LGLLGLLGLLTVLARLGLLRVLAVLVLLRVRALLRVRPRAALRVLLRGLLVRAALEVLLPVRVVLLPERPPGAVRVTALRVRPRLVSPLRTHRGHAAQPRPITGASPADRSTASG
ncbi:hypothetical protein, partial [Streptomyces sp. NRRL S-495]|uniref:hypothetical protein n=1 Tax=Streptomyces sp. NRRL S-495 TaxID=1609133 RepID=UPI0005F95C4E